MRQAWNQELINENRYLKSLLLEPKVESKQVYSVEDFKPIGGITTWKNVRNRLEVNASKKKTKNENPQPEES